MAMTLIPIALIFVVILGIGLVTNTRRSVAVTTREMSKLVETLAQRFDGELRRVAQVAELTAETITTCEDLTEDEIYRLLENGVSQDQLIYGAAMGFTARAFDHREAFCPSMSTATAMRSIVSISPAHTIISIHRTPCGGTNRSRPADPCGPSRISTKAPATL